MTLPRILLIDVESSIQKGNRYSIYVGYKDDEIVCLALSRYNDTYTVGKLMLETDVCFHSSTVFVDVYGDSKRPSVIIARFWSKVYVYCSREEPFDLLTNDNTKAEWSARLGADVSFDPLGGPKTYPERFPGFFSQKQRLPLSMVAQNDHSHIN